MSVVNDNNLRRYLAYGAAIVTDLDLSQFLPNASSGLLTLTLTRQREKRNVSKLKPGISPFEGHGRVLSIYTDRDFARSVSGQPWYFEVNGIARFHWTGGDTRISYDILAESNDELLAFWLIHIFLPLWFTLEGQYEFIHAGAVEIGGNPILFMAPSMGGKSTITDYFLRQGHGHISDDKVAIVQKGEQFLALPSHPNQRPYRKFEDLGKPVNRFFDQALPIYAIYYLRKVDPADSVQINEIIGHRKFAGMRPGYLFDFPFLKIKRLEFMAKLASTVPFFELSLPWNLRSLGAVYKEVCAHNARLIED